MIKFDLQFFGGRGSSGGKATEAAIAAANTKPEGTMSTDKSYEQIHNEVEQLQSLPAGSRIVRVVDGEEVEYIAHDQAYVGRNGRYLRRRVYSVPTNETYRNGLPKLVTDTTDPYYIAQGQWKKKK